MRAGTPVKRRSQTERRQEAESKLIDSAIGLIASKGFEGFALAEVGEAAGYSRGLPVHYFGTKDKLLACVAEHVVSTFYDALRQLPPVEDGLPKVIQLVRQYAAVPITPDLRALVVLIAHASVHEVIKDAIGRLNARGVQVLKDELRKGVAVGNVKAGVDRLAVARMIYAFMRGQLAFAVMDPQFDSVAVTEEFVCSLEARLVPDRAAKPSPSTRRTPKPATSPPDSSSSKANGHARPAAKQRAARGSSAQQ